MRDHAVAHFSIVGGRGEFEFSQHAFQRVVERNISEDGIIQAANNARLIEDYPKDKNAPGAQILGFTAAGRPLHIQISYIDSNLVKIIVIYQPDRSQWKDDFTSRRLK